MLHLHSLSGNVFGNGCWNRTNVTGFKVLRLNHSANPQLFGARLWNRTTITQPLSRTLRVNTQPLPQYILDSTGFKSLISHYLVPSVGLEPTRLSATGSKPATSTIPSQGRNFCISIWRRVKESNPCRLSPAAGGSSPVCTHCSHTPNSLP